MENLYFYYTYIDTYNTHNTHIHMLENIYFFISMKKKTKEKNTIHKDTYTHTHALWILFFITCARFKREKYIFKSSNKNIEMQLQKYNNKSSTFFYK